VIAYLIHRYKTPLQKDLIAGIWTNSVLALSIFHASQAGSWIKTRSFTPDRVYTHGQPLHRSSRVVPIHFLFCSNKELFCLLKLKNAETYKPRQRRPITTADTAMTAITTPQTPPISHYCLESSPICMRPDEFAFKACVVFMRSRDSN